MPILSRYNDKGRVFKGEEFSIRPDNRAFRYGDGLFETVLVHNGRPVFWEAHWKRMLEGMKILGFSFELEQWQQEMNAVVASLLADQDRATLGRIRITVYRGGGGHYLPSDNRPEIFAEIQPLKGEIWPIGKPQTVGIAHDYPIQHAVLSAVKSLNALPYVLAARLAEQKGWNDALLRSNSGEVAETSSANTFLVIQGRLITPRLASGCLPGVMRAHVIACASRLGINTSEEAINIPRFNEASEVFSTNVVKGLQPIGHVDETVYNASEFPVLNQIRLEILRGLA